MEANRRPAPPGRARHRLGGRGVRIAGGTAFALGLAAGGYALAGAASSPGAVLATTAAGSPSGSTPAPPGRWRGLPGGPGRPSPLLAGGAGGLVTGVSSSSITLQTPAGTIKTVQVTSSTTYDTLSAGPGSPTTITLAGITDGEDVVVRPTSATAGTSSPVAEAVVVVGPRVAGRVVSVSGSTIVVADGQGFYRSVVTSSSTTVTSSGSTSSLSAVAPGSFIDAFGTMSTDHAVLDASSIAILPAAPVRGGLAPYGLGGPMGWRVHAGVGEPIPGRAGSISAGPSGT